MKDRPDTSGVDVQCETARQRLTEFAAVIASLTVAEKTMLDSQIQAHGWGGIDDVLAQLQVLPAAEVVAAFERTGLAEALTKGPRRSRAAQ